jgi:hypothetical protein
MAIEHENILKVVHINYGQLSKGFIEFIELQQPTYRDQILREDLYSLEDILEEQDNNSPYPTDVLNQLSEIGALLKDLGCSYFRVVYS